VLVGHAREGFVGLVGCMDGEVLRRALPSSGHRQELRMSMTSFPTSTLIAYHDSAHGGGSGNLAVLFVFLGVLATAAWLIFSEMRWRNTLLITAAGWVVVVGLSLAF
jgi:hypothetical protein